MFTASRPPVRSWAATFASAAAHGLALVGVVSLAKAAALAPLPQVNRSLTFFNIRVAPALSVPVESVHLPALAREAPRTEELAPPVVDPVPPPPKAPEVARAEPPRPFEAPVVVERPKPAVTLGAFPSAGSVAHAYEPPQAVERAGFDAPAARAQEIRTVSAKVGTFDQQPSAAPKPGSDRANVVADAGFGTATVARASEQARRIADAGFGAAAAAPAQKPEPQRTVQATDFDSRPAPPAAARAPREVRIEIPVEILSKPTPAYTDEARTMRIEGDVVLEVEFRAGGEINVVRVVRGLGHGLDESATRAARAIRFKPAQSGGRPIDFRTTVHILFRLA